MKSLVTKDLAGAHFATDVTFEGPLMPKLSGRETILGFLKRILPLIHDIKIKQHITDGDFVATVFDMETVNGVDHVVDVCRVIDGELKEIRAFYYPEQASR